MAMIARSFSGRAISPLEVSWIENNYGENHNHVIKKFDFETWVNSPESDQSFEFDVNGAAICDIFIYYAPSAKAAAAECGIYYGQRFHSKTIPMIALWSKGEDFGLMRKMFDFYCERHNQVVPLVDEIERTFLKTTK